MFVYLLQRSKFIIRKYSTLHIVCKAKMVFFTKNALLKPRNTSPDTSTNVSGLYFYCTYQAMCKNAAMG